MNKMVAFVLFCTYALYANSGASHEEWAWDAPDCRTYCTIAPLLTLAQSLCTLDLQITQVTIQCGISLPHPSHYINFAFHCFRTVGTLNDPTKPAQSLD